MSFAPKPQTFHIETVGCQMNILDSELVRAGLIDAGFVPADELKRADIIFFNTCSVRGHAEDKVYSALGRLKHVKTHRPGTIIGVMGCMAQKDQQTIFRRAPHVDLVVGPGQIGHIPAMIREANDRRSTMLQRNDETSPADSNLSAELIQVSIDRRGRKRDEVAASYEQYDPDRLAEARPSRYQAMVRAMLGCDKFCSYCIVPSVRGPEQSRPAIEIVDETRRLADQGCIEVTLIGQAVNCYRDESEGRAVVMADLLERINAIDGIRRIKFVTNYPTHMTDDLLHAVHDLKKVSPYLHVPAQSGSDRMLKLMRRQYTAGEYRDMIDRVRGIVPEAAVTSDFIVGFCGETDEDFQQTVDLVRYGRFKNSFIFKYSERTGTKAAELYDDDVPYPIKQRRNNELLAVQNEISLKLNQPLLDQTVEILVEGPSKTSRKRDESGETVQMCGRTVCDRIIVFEGSPELAGQIIPVRITEINAFTIFGVVG